MYVIHHRTGVIAFAFLVVHPLVLSFQFATDSFEDVSSFLSPIGNTTPITFGILSILSMLVLLFVTFYGSYFQYPTLKLAHRFLGAAFFLGFIHVFLIPSSLSSDMVLKVSLLSTCIVGLLVFSYRTLFGKLSVSRFEYVVTSVVPIAGGITEINLLTSSLKRLYHLPGQFGILSFPKSSHVSQEEHPFTISSAGKDGKLRFSIKGLGDYTNAVAEMKVGEKARVEGPFGEFCFLYGKQKQVWVAGGVGVTPFVSMAEYMMSLDTLPYNIVFYYSIRTEQDGAYKELFTEVAKKHSSFVFHCMPSDTKGYITGQLLLTDNADLESRDVYICGPPLMMEGLATQLLTLKVPKKNIHIEKFSLLK